MGDSFYKDGSDAMLAPFEPKTPCRVMETRPCVILSLLESHRFKVDECEPNGCVRFPGRDREPFV